MNKEIEKLLKDILEVDRLDGVRLEWLCGCKYLILLDMGCGSTSAAFLDLKRYIDSGELSPENYIYPVTWNYNQVAVGSRRLVRVRGNVSIPTLIGYSSLGPVAGPEALTTGNSCENFKACPSGQNLDKVILQIENFDGSLTPKRLRDVWPNYFGCIMDLICGWCAGKHIGPQSREELANGETVVMAAHPAGEEWSEPAALQSYRELIAAGTGLPDENILTVSEAKAAMQYVRRKYRKLDFDRGIVIADIGASTIDVEYLTRKSANPIEYSFELAGRNVDRILAHYVLEQVFPDAMKKYPARDAVPEEDFFMELDLPFGKSQFMFDIRLIKETLSDMERDAAAENASVKAAVGQYGAVEISAGLLRSLLGDAPGDPLHGAAFGSQDITAVYELPLLEYIRRQNAGKMARQPHGRRAVQLVDDTWYGHLEDMLRFVLDELKEAGHSVSQVIVTGGSCRLLGLKEHVWRAVSSSRTGIYDKRNILYMDTENDYENSVPFGGGYYVGGVLSHMDELVNFPARLYDTLFEELQAVAAERTAGEVNRLVQEITLDALKWWSGQKEDSASCSVRALNEEIGKRCGKVFNNTDQLNHAVERAVNSITARDLPKTMAEIKVLLDALAQTQFTGKVDTKTLKIHLPASSVLKAV
ncbi:MAG: hypothetical protein K2O18_05880, partial [Oscillospiraceae bacterium]|nr:hypothetical protein [Oscillospiraceae bacterium]